MELISEDAQTVNVSAIDQLMLSMVEQRDQINQEANSILNAFQESSNSWLLVPQIIAQAQNSYSLFFGLSTFIKGVQKSWGTLDDTQRRSFQTFFFQLVMKWSSESMPEHLLNSANEVLIEILKNDWPEFWPNFMHDFIQSISQNVDSSINGMRLLSMLCEETHEQFDELLLPDRQTELLRALENDFTIILTYLEHVFNESKNQKEMNQALITFSRYLHYIELQKAISSSICQAIAHNIFLVPEYQYGVLCCFDSIATHSMASGDQLMRQVFDVFIGNVAAACQNIPDYLSALISNSELLFKLIQTIGDFLLLDQSSLLQGILTETAAESLKYLVELTEVSEDEAFKNAVEIWHDLSRTFYLEQHRVTPPPFVIQKLQYIFVKRMAEPPELLDLFPQDLNNAQGQELYQLMRQTSVCLSHLERENMKLMIMQFLSNPETVYNACFSIGAISGTFNLQEEQSFLSGCLEIIYSYLNSFDATAIQKMQLYGSYFFICSLYPRFFYQNWPHQKILANNILQAIHIPDNYEFQKATVNIFKTISYRNAKPFIMLYEGEKETTIAQYLSQLGRIAQLLPLDLMPTFFQGLAIIIGNVQDMALKTQLINELIVLPNKSWENALMQLQSSSADEQLPLKIHFSLVVFSKIIQINEVAPLFNEHIEHVVKFTVDIYNFITNESRKFEVVPLPFKQIKESILKFYNNFFQVYQQNIEIIQHLVKMLIEDYSTSSPAQRFYQVLDCLTTVINKIQIDDMDFFNEIYVQVVQSTYEMLNGSYEQYIDIVVPYSFLLTSLMTVFAQHDIYLPEFYKFMMNCFLWGISHPKSDISSKVLDCLSACIQQMAKCTNLEFKQFFYDEFYMSIVFTLFDVMTDTSHKYLFNTISQTFNHLLMQVNGQMITLTGHSSTDNFVADSLTAKLSENFPHINEAYLLEFSRSLITEARNLGNFKDLLRKFLILIKKVMPSDRDLYKSEIEQKNSQIEGYNGMEIPDGDDGDISEF